MEALLEINWNFYLSVAELAVLLGFGYLVYKWNAEVRDDPL